MIVRDTILVQQRFDKYLVVGFVNTANQLEQQGLKARYFFYLGVQCQRYDNWSNAFLSENYLKRFINGLVKRYYDIYKLGDNKKG